MDIDRNSELIILTEEESQVIGLPDYRDWPLSAAGRLIEITCTQMNRVDDIDTSSTPFMAERARLLAMKQRDGHLLRLMLDQLSPYASENLADETAAFLRGYES